MQHVYIQRKNGLINVIQINFAVLNVTEPNPVAELTNAGVYGRDARITTSPSGWVDGEAWM